jgi:hypothetical protein
VEQLLTTEQPAAYPRRSMRDGPSQTFMTLVHTLLRSVEIVLESSMHLISRFDSDLSSMDPSEADSHAFPCFFLQVCSQIIRSDFFVFSSFCILFSFTVFFPFSCYAISLFVLVFRAKLLERLFAILRAFLTPQRERVRTEYLEKFMVWSAVASGCPWTLGSNPLPEFVRRLLPAMARRELDSNSLKWSRRKKLKLKYGRALTKGEEGKERQGAAKARLDNCVQFVLGQRSGGLDCTGKKTLDRGLLSIFVLCCLLVLHFHAFAFAFEMISMFFHAPFCVLNICINIFYLVLLSCVVGVLLFDQIPVEQLPIRLRSWTLNAIKAQLLLRSLQFQPGGMCHVLEVALSNAPREAKQLGFIGSLKLLCFCHVFVSVFMSRMIWVWAFSGAKMRRRLSHSFKAKPAAVQRLLDIMEFERKHKLHQYYSAVLFNSSSSSPSLSSSSSSSPSSSSSSSSASFLSSSSLASSSSSIGPHFVHISGVHDESEDADLLSDSDEDEVVDEEELVESDEEEQLYTVHQPLPSAPDAVPVTALSAAASAAADASLTVPHRYGMRNHQHAYDKISSFLYSSSDERDLPAG